MSSSNLTSKSVGAGMLTAIVASLCCITPVISLVAGVGGMAAAFSWMEPFRPYLIALTVGILGFAWYQKLQSRTAKEIQCACEEDKKPSFWQSGKFLGIVTIFTAFMLAFPTYAHIFYPNANQNTILSSENARIKLADLDVTGMTCSGCEEHVKHSTMQLKGVLEATVSYKDESAQIKYNAGLVSIDKIIEAVNNTGYKVIATNVSEWSASPVLIQQDTFNTIKLSVKGMTCSGCELHIKNVLGQIGGIKKVDASYISGTTTITYLPTQIDRDQIIVSINKTGYTVVDQNEQPLLGLTEDDGNISFYKVPMVCSAAPTIGCGSRSKPVLLEFEKSVSVKEAWLNRQGTIIAIVWGDNIDLKVRKNVITKTFSKYQVNANELLMNDYAESYTSFSKGKDWYRSSDVNTLSKEEAGIIADQLMKPIKAKSNLNFTAEHKMREKIIETFYDFFLNYQSIEELGDTKVYRAMLSDIIIYGEDLLGEDKMPTLDELWKSCSNAAKSCNHEGCSGTSCNLSKKS